MRRFSLCYIFKDILMQYIILHILGSELSQGIGSNDYGSQEDLDLQLTIWKANWIAANPSSKP